MKLKNKSFIQTKKPNIMTHSLDPEMMRILASINDRLGILVNEVENKKKKSNTKKEETHTQLKRNLYAKKKDGTIVFTPYTDMFIDANRNTFYNIMRNEYPNICMMEETLTFEEYVKLVERFTRPEVRDMMDQLDNFKHINKYISAYKALYNWLLRDERKNAAAKH